MSITDFLINNWHIKAVSAILILAAWIDGRELKVPNWITFPMILSGLVYSTCVGGLGGLGAGVLGMCVGLLTLLPLYAVGGMGAGDVKLMAGIGAWLGWEITFAAFCVSTVVGALMAVVMVLWKRSMKHHYENFLLILSEWMVIKNPYELSRIAAKRKPTMMLLPYGIPICIGTIGYFLYQGMM
ncbi:MAG TPA: A24 family peptidase [Planctomycetaceae bacterium]|nr:A24 family peptidase [Planctomycetaceae bacterium]HQZ64259.1 A24 family peptidase [Planctomycetaceae bacterium]